MIYLIKCMVWFRVFYQSIPLRLVSKYLQEIGDRSVDTEIYTYQGTDNTVIILSKPFTAYGLTVPSGFSWDGASVPWFARWILPKFYKILKASCRHDRACELAQNWFERFIADLIFFLMVFYTEKRALWRCVLGLIGVRIGSYLGFGKNY